MAKSIGYKNIIPYLVLCSIQNRNRQLILRHKIHFYCVNLLYESYFIVYHFFRNHRKRGVCNHPPLNTITKWGVGHPPNQVQAAMILDLCPPPGLKKEQRLVDVDLGRVSYYVFDIYTVYSMFYIKTKLTLFNAYFITKQPSLFKLF